MNKLKYKIDKKGYFITECKRGILIGSRFCMSCSYCYNHDAENKTVTCRKENNEAQDEYDHFN